MSVKSKATRAPASNSKKNGRTSKGKKSVSRTLEPHKEARSGGPQSAKGPSVKGSSAVKYPKNAEEATLLAWGKTYENRNKRFKI